MRLTASAGRALLDGQPVAMDTSAGGLPDELCLALRRWAWLAEHATRAGAPDTGTAAGGPAGGVDGGGGAGNGAGGDAAAVARNGARLAAMVAAVLHRPVEYVDPISGRSRVVGQPRRPTGAGREPTPWPTGLAVLGFVAAVSAGLDQALTAALRADYHWVVWVPANVLVGAGLAPTLLLLRRRLVWRWVVHGVALGLLGSWLGLVLMAAL